MRWILLAALLAIGCKKSEPTDAPADRSTPNGTSERRPDAQPEIKANVTEVICPFDAAAVKELASRHHKNAAAAKDWYAAGRWRFEGRVAKVLDRSSGGKVGVLIDLTNVGKVSMSALVRLPETEAKELEVGRSVAVNAKIAEYAGAAVPPIPALALIDGTLVK